MQSLCRYLHPAGHPVVAVIDDLQGDIVANRTKGTFRRWSKTTSRFSICNALDWTFMTLRLPVDCH